MHRTVPLLHLFFLQAVSLNILFYAPRLAYSHVNFLGRVADTLAEDGHNVTFLQASVIEQMTFTGITKSKLLEIKSSDKINSLLAEMSASSSENRWITDETDTKPIATYMKFLSRITLDICQSISKNDTFFPGVTRDEQLLRQLKDSNFDIAFTQPLEPCGLGIFHILGIEKYISLFSSGFGASYPSLLGAPMSPSSVPSFASALSEQMNMRERLENLISSIDEKQILTVLYPEFDAFFRTIDPNFPGMAEKLGRSSLGMANADWILDYPRPLIHKMQYIGGIAVPEVQPLDKEWTDILSLRKFSILVSFGSMARSIDMPNDFKDSLITAFANFPDVTFIWKYEDEDRTFLNGTKNIVLKKWLPQPALLASPKLTAFLTHAGPASMHELSARGKKSIVVPLFADQYVNARLLQRAGNAIYFEKENLANTTKVQQAIQRVLTDEELHKKASKIANMIAGKPFTPRQILLRYTKFVAKYGPLSNLDPRGRTMSTISYYLIDVIVVISLASLLVLGCLFLSCRCLFKATCARKLKTE